MRTIEFIHELIPPNSTAQQRRMNSKGGFLNAKGKLAQATWRAVMERHAPGKPLDGALEFKIILTYPHTRNTCKKSNKIYSKTGVVVPIPKTTRPDDDNLLKMIKDALTKCGYWHDDSQTFSTSISRYHHDTPGIYIKINEINEVGNE